MEVLAKGYILVVKCLNTDKCLMRYPNDVKIFEGHIADPSAVIDNSDNNNDWKKAYEVKDHAHCDDSRKTIILSILL